MGVKKYIVHVNTEKNPEIVAKFEQEKKQDGISRYIKTLVISDLKKTENQSHSNQVHSSDLFGNVKKQNGFE